MSGSKECYCQNANSPTYNSKFTNGDKTYGGYANYWRGPSHFVFKIPDAIPSDKAAPLLCGGITTFSPLKRNGAGPGKRVGIIGIGGLGHFGILGAKALGCDKIVAISRSSSKKEDAFEMGATDFIATGEDKSWYKKHRQTLDLVICTVSSPKMPLRQYLQLLRVDGQFIQVGAPEDVLPPVSAFHLITKGVKIGGSSIGSPQEIRDMLALFAEKKVMTWNQNVPMKDANRAIVDMENGKARYRYVLVNEGSNAQPKL
jgi:alcohol dehydrogenase (NADP+)